MGMAVRLRPQTLVPGWMRNSNVPSTLPGQAACLTVLELTSNGLPGS